MHSKCALELVTNASFHGMTVYCPGCSESLWSHSTYSPNEQTLPQAFLDEIKTLKPIVSQFKKSLIAFRKKVMEGKEAFKAQVAPHIEAIKAAKKAQKDAIKASDEYKTYVKFHRSYMRNANTLAITHNLSVRTVNQQFKILWWRSNPMRYINGNLYVRI
jgi:hypothetical protein